MVTGIQPSVQFRIVGLHKAGIAAEQGECFCIEFGGFGRPVIPGIFGEWFNGVRGYELNKRAKSGRVWLGSSVERVAASVCSRVSRESPGVDPVRPRLHP